MTDTPDTTPAETIDSRAIRQRILDRCETSQQSQWIRAAYNLGHIDGAAAQREADIKLARDYRVMVCLRRNDDGTVYYLHRKDFYPFADLLAAAPEETGIRAAVTAVCDSMGIDPEQPMTADQHAEFGPRLAAALAAEAVR